MDSFAELLFSFGHHYLEIDQVLDNKLVYLVHGIETASCTPVHKFQLMLVRF